MAPIRGAVIVGVATLPAFLSACGSGTAGALNLSISSGPPGTAVNITGNAGRGCAPNRPTSFLFERSGGPAGPGVQVSVPVTAAGTWRATFVVPPYLGPASGRAQGLAVLPGRYELIAKRCSGHGSGTSGFTVTAATAASERRYVAIAPTLDGGGYWLAQADGTVQRFGDAPWYGSAHPDGSPIVAIARTYDEQGYWLVAASGEVYAFGDARRYGSLSHQPGAPIVDMATTPDGQGYWLLAANGHIYGFGNAHVVGMPSLGQAPYDAIGTRLGGGYIVTSAANAGVYQFPGGQLAAGGPGYATAASFVGSAVTPSGNGTFQADAIGDVLVTGDATNYGSVTANRQDVSSPVTGIATTPTGQGYWLLGSDGNVYNFGNAPYYGSGLK